MKIGVLHFSTGVGSSGCWLICFVLRNCWRYFVFCCLRVGLESLGKIVGFRKVLASCSLK